MKTPPPNDMPSRPSPQQLQDPFPDRVEIASDFYLPPLSPSLSSLLSHFDTDIAKHQHPLRNPHHESRVSEATRKRAKSAAVLFPIVNHPEQLTVLLTRRHHSISFPGQICFPGGRCDAEDANEVQAALREAQEEIGLQPQQVRILGRMGDYYTHSGFCIAPIMGLVSPPLNLVPHPGEVAEIIEIPLAHMLRSDSYRLRRHPFTDDRAHFSVIYKDATINGPTVSLLMGFYEQLAQTHLRAAT